MTNIFYTKFINLYEVIYNQGLSLLEYLHDSYELIPQDEFDSLKPDIESDYFNFQYLMCEN